MAGDARRTSPPAAQNCATTLIIFHIADRKPHVAAPRKIGPDYLVFLIIPRWSHAVSEVASFSNLLSFVFYNITASFGNFGRLGRLWSAESGSDHCSGEY